MNDVKVGDQVWIEWHGKIILVTVTKVTPEGIYVK